MRKFWDWSPLRSRVDVDPKQPIELWFQQNIKMMTKDGAELFASGILSTAFKEQTICVLIKKETPMDIVISKATSILVSFSEN